MEHFISDDDRAYTEGYPPVYKPGPVARGVYAAFVISIWGLAFYGLYAIAVGLA